MNDHLNDDQLIRYAFDLATDRQHRADDKHLHACPLCRERLEQLKRKFASLDLLQRAPAVSEELFAKTVADVSSTAVRAVRFSHRAWIAAAAAVAILITGTLLLYSPKHDVTKVPGPAASPKPSTFAAEDRGGAEGADEFIPEQPPFAPASNIELVTLPRRENVQLTICNSADLTLVRERRNLTMKRGWNWLQFMWANTLIDPTSLTLQPLEHADKIEVDELTFPPRLKQLGRWLIKSQVSGSVPFEITYLTSGLSWRAFYMGTMTGDEKTMRLQAYVRVTNQSGEEYENAQTRLIVGKVHILDKIVQLAQRQYPYDRPGLPRVSGGYWFGDKFLSSVNGDGAAHGRIVVMDMAGSLGRPKEIKKEGLSEYFLYTIEGTETIPNGWAKRLPSLQADDVPVKSLYKYDEERFGRTPVRYVAFTNDEEHKLGQTPLPDGNIKIYRIVNDQGNLSYVGGSNTKYIPVNEKVELNLGPARRVKIEPTLMDTRTDNTIFDVNGNIAGWDQVQLWRVVVSNTRKLPVAIEITRGFGTPYWTLRTDAEYTKHDATHARFELTVEPQTKRTLTYTLTTYHGQRQEGFQN